MTYTEVGSSTTLTGVTRGTGGSTAAAHASGVQVAQFDNGGIPKYVVRILDNNYILCILVLTNKGRLKND